MSSGGSYTRSCFGGSSYFPFCCWLCNYTAAYYELLPPAFEGDYFCDDFDCDYYYWELLKVGHSSLLPLTAAAAPTFAAAWLVLRCFNRLGDLLSSTSKYYPLLFDYDVDIYYVVVVVVLVYYVEVLYYVLLFWRIRWLSSICSSV